MKSNGADGAFIIYEYDAEHRIKSNHHHLPASASAPERDFKYTFNRDNDNRITDIKGGDLKDFFQTSEAFEYDSKGRWIKTTISTIPASTYHTIVIPEYNEEGLIVKATQTLYGSSNAYPKVRTYEYKDGNLISSREISKDLVITSQYEYFLDKERKESELYTLSSYNFGLGTPSKNLLKNIKTFNQGQLMETSYTYIVDGLGYVQKQTTKVVVEGVVIGNSEGIYTYKCY